MPKLWHVGLLCILLLTSLWGLVWVAIPRFLAWSDRAAEIRDGRIRLERFNRRIRPRNVLDCRIEPVERRPGAHHFSIVYRDLLNHAECWSIVVDDLPRAELFRAKILAMKEEATAASG
jgi:hypothetical protein